MDCKSGRHSRRGGYNVSGPDWIEAPKREHRADTFDEICDRQ